MPDKPAVDTSRGYLLSTSTGWLPEKARHGAGFSPKTMRIIDRLKACGSTSSTLAALNDDLLEKLITSSDGPFALPFPVDVISFLKWDSQSFDKGLYEYNTRREELVIKGLQGPLHSGIVEILVDWLMQVKRSGEFEQQGNLRLRQNQGLFSRPSVEFDRS